MNDSIDRLIHVEKQTNWFIKDRNDRLIHEEKNWLIDSSKKIDSWMIKKTDWLMY